MAVVILNQAQGSDLLKAVSRQPIQLTAEPPLLSGMSSASD